MQTKRQHPENKIVAFYSPVNRERGEDENATKTNTCRQENHRFSKKKKVILHIEESETK
ncbi:MAG: hypothetical protein SOV83_06505 [Prevotella sp.]|nr:hypothetical protein [Prevotella sp.]